VAQFRVVPVMDVKGGLVVHAVGGNRSQYKPITSILTGSPDPLAVAHAFLERFGFKEMYVADLDALAGGKPNFTLFRSIAESTGMSLMVDAGVHSDEAALSLLDAGVSRVVSGSETLRNVEEISQILSSIGSEHLTVSIDTRGGELLSKGLSMSPGAFASCAERLGVLEVILLSLSKVGAADGVDISLFKEVTQGLKLRALVGGGVAATGDLLAVRQAGAAGVLQA